MKGNAPYLVRHLRQYMHPSTTSKLSSPPPFTLSLRQNTLVPILIDCCAATKGSYCQELTGRQKVERGLGGLKLLPLS
jgi:hypothetical protein